VNGCAGRSVAFDLRAAGVPPGGKRRRSGRGVVSFVRNLLTFRQEAGRCCKWLGGRRFGRSPLFHRLSPSRGCHCWLVQQCLSGVEKRLHVHNELSKTRCLAPHETALLDKPAVAPARRETSLRSQRTVEDRSARLHETTLLDKPAVAPKRRERSLRSQRTIEDKTPRSKRDGTAGQAGSGTRRAIARHCSRSRRHRPGTCR
jgi:hypothetical protein